MNHQEKLAFIRGKCVEANPGVVNGSIGVCVNGTYVEKRKTTRTIHLADVLLAINQKDKEGFIYGVCSNGQFYHDFGEQKAWSEDGNTMIIWNLRKDDLNDQEPATIDFIYDLLK